MFAKKKQIIDYKAAIKNTFGQYAHSEVVLKRAIRNCKSPEILEYIDKTIKELPRWENRFNVVWAIVFGKELLSCKVCKKALPFSNVLENKVYCSDACEKADQQAIAAASKAVAPAAEVKPVKPEQPKQGLFSKIKNIFSKK